MKNIIGFGRSDDSLEVIAPSVEETRPQEPVRSLVSVRFPDEGRTFSYYNDRFDLEPGDVVFVDGKLAGKIGIVEKVTRKFKINLAEYKRVISVADREIHGTYESIIDRMVSFDADAFSPKQFRSWALPPKNASIPEDEEGENEVIFGEGYEIDLSDLESAEDLSDTILERAYEYCNDDNVAYICVRNGIGTAYIEGTSWYEVNFTLEGSVLKEMYCDCPYPGLCKHLAAVAVVLRELNRHREFSLKKDFVVFDRSRFWFIVGRNTKKVTL